MTHPPLSVVRQEALEAEVGRRLGRRALLGAAAAGVVGSATVAGAGEPGPPPRARVPCGCSSRAAVAPADGTCGPSPARSTGGGCPTGQRAGRGGELGVGGHGRHDLPRGRARGPGQGPRAFFETYGVPERDVLTDAVAVAATAKHDGPGPHVVTGPIAVRGAEPGDILRIEMLDLPLRVPYGVISNRHGKGALPGEYPEQFEGTPSSSPTSTRAATSASSPRSSGAGAGCADGSRARCRSRSPCTVPRHPRRGPRHLGPGRLRAAHRRRRQHRHQRPRGRLDALPARPGARARCSSPATRTWPRATARWR